MAYVGDCYYKGKGVARDYANNLAVCYTNGQGVDQDDQLAAGALRTPAGGRVVRARCVHGQCKVDVRSGALLRARQGCCADLTQARHLYARAAARGDPAAADALERHSDGTQQDASPPTPDATRQSAAAAASNARHRRNNARLDCHFDMPTCTITGRRH